MTLATKWKIISAVYKKHDSQIHVVKRKKYSKNIRRQIVNYCFFAPNLLYMGEVTPVYIKTQR